MNETTRKCPVCAQEIILEAKVCQSCGARFMVRETGYCENCHRLVNVNSSGRCFTCNGELTNRHIVSVLIKNTLPSSASESASISGSKPVLPIKSPTPGTTRKPPLSVKNALFRRRMLTAGIPAIFLLSLALFSIIRYIIDQNNLANGLAAFEQADCIAANSHFDKIIQGWQLLDLGNLKAQAQAKQESCRPFLSAAEKEKSGQYADALSAFADLTLSDTTAPSLARASRERVGSLFDSHQPSELTNLEICEKMPKIQSAGMIPQPEVRLPELYFACATAYQAGGKDNEAVNLYKQILMEYPYNARAVDAEQALLSNLAACEQVNSLASESALSSRRDFVVRFYYGCGQMYDQVKASSGSFHMFMQVLIDYPDHALASEAEKALLANSLSCENVATLQKEAAITARPDFIPSLLFNCGQKFENEQQYQNAVDLYENFIANYPNHYLAPDVNIALARSMVNAAKASGASEISAPSRSGGTGIGSTQVIIQNDSPEKLRLVFSGPEALIVELAACGECTPYMIKPFSCPEKGPLGRYTLQPGTYDVLVESISDSGVTPYTGSWDLVSGDEYSSCFYTIQRFTP